MIELFRGIKVDWLGKRKLFLAISGSIMLLGLVSLVVKGGFRDGVDFRGGTLVYIAFRFEWIYGAAAVFAVFHDTLVTLGLFSLFNREINLTVIAALLTLVGYSVNDTIVVFDRVRENLKIRRRDDLETIMNDSINQTLSRTILTSGLTFLTVLSLFVFGGEIINHFAFAMVIAIIIGTYSSIASAARLVLFYENLRGKAVAKPVVAARSAQPKVPRPAKVK